VRKGRARGFLAYCPAVVSPSEEQPGENSFFARRGRVREAPPVLGHVRAGECVGDYRLVEPLGRGGMGQVWVAQQLSLGRAVALKLVLPERVSAEALALFAREARAGGRLAHPGIVTVHDHGQSDGRAWIAMELVEGAWTLRDFLDEMLVTEDLPDDYYSRVAEFCAATADALESAHRGGVIHRDVKPGNILVTPTDSPKVTDFGLAKIMDETAVSRTGDFAGTYAYMSPEQVAAKRVGIDHRTDVFSLGVVLYEMLTLRRPFEGDTSRQLAQQILMRDPPDPRAIRSRVPRDLAVIAGKCLEKDVLRRYQTMAELAADLRRYLSDEPILARPPGRLRRLRLWALRNPAKSLSGAVAALAFVVIAVLLAANVRTNRALGLEVASVKRLSALQDYDELMAQVDRLWPPHPENIEAYEAWIADARSLLRDLPLHHAKRAELRALALPRAGEERDEAEWSFPDDARDSAWWHANLSKLIESLEGLLDPESGLLSGSADAVSALHGWSVPRRLALATRIRDGLVGGSDWSDRWDEAIEAIEHDARYSGPRLTPQAGLVPIGPDPESGLWEFWHVASGEEPPRGDDGRLAPTDETGLLLVLIPGGVFWMGAQTGDPDGRNYDPDAEKDEGPVHEVTLAAFFLSKYEMTRGQWQRFTGSDPSYTADSPLTSLSYPLEQVSWLDCDSTLPRMGLALPTEAQWEYAARGGTSSPWWTGEEGQLLSGAANVSDRTAKKRARWPEFDDWEDGYIMHAPVSDLLPNPFGLHNVHGNVLEWCRDGYAGYDVPVRPGDGERQASGARGRVSRGGCLSLVALYARSSYRSNSTPEGHNFNLGVRPARAVTAH